MADYTMGSETVTRIVYRLATPTNATELDKMVHAAAREYAEKAGVHSTSVVPDDALTVDVRDDEITIWWEVPTG